MRGRLGQMPCLWGKVLPARMALETSCLP